MEGMMQQMLQEVWLQPKGSARIDTILNQISQLQLESQHLVISHFYKFKEVLTPEQSEIFYKIVSERFPGQQRNSCLRQIPNRRKARE